VIRMPASGRLPGAGAPAAAGESGPPVVEESAGRCERREEALERSNAGYATRPPISTSSRGAGEVEALAPITGGANELGPPTRCPAAVGRQGRSPLGGEKRRVALCRLLLSEAQNSLLPTSPLNHLDAESVAWLEQFLQRFPRTVVAVTHDRSFPRQRRRLDPELDRGYGIRGRAIIQPARAKQKPCRSKASRSKARIKAMPARALEWCGRTEGRQFENRRRVSRVRELSSQEHQEDGTRPRRSHPGASAWVTR